MDKIYHIYAKDKCFYAGLNETKFQAVWKDLNLMVGLLKTDYSESDLSYEELTVHKDVEASY